MKVFKRYFGMQKNKEVEQQNVVVTFYCLSSNRSIIIQYNEIKLKHSFRQTYSNRGNNNIIINSHRILF